MNDEQKNEPTDEQGEPTWLLLIKQIPPDPAYLRVKIGRRLAKIGAVPIKNSVFALPAGDSFREDLEWIVREIEAGGGEGSICEARFLEGLSGGKVRALFNDARDQDYGQLAEEARACLEDRPAAELDEDGRAQARRDLGRLKRRLDETAALDFFNAPGRAEAEAALVALEGRLRQPARARQEPSADEGLEALRGRTWVTRVGLHVDRLACGWLIRRFVDPEARFKFVAPKGYAPKKGELRFDMFDAEFTHEGDACTFEVLIERLLPGEPRLRAIAEIVHDLDLKDGKFGRPETAGFGALLEAVIVRQGSDDDRLLNGAALFDDLYAWFGGGGREKA